MAVEDTDVISDSNVEHLEDAEQGEQDVQQFRAEA